MSFFADDTGSLMQQKKSSRLREKPGKGILKGENIPRRVPLCYIAPHTAPRNIFLRLTLLVVKIECKNIRKALM